MNKEMYCIEFDANLKRFYIDIRNYYADERKKATLAIPFDNKQFYTMDRLFRKMTDIVAMCENKDIINITPELHKIIEEVNEKHLG